MTMGLAPDRGVEGFVHEVLICEGMTGFLAGTVPWIRAGLDAGDAVAVLVASAKLEALRDALGDAARAVRFVDVADVGRNPARIIPVWREFVDEQVERGRPFRGVGEPVGVGRTAAELRECELHEILLGPAFRDGPAWQLLCPYDVSVLEPAAIELARRSHPYVAEGLTARPSRHYRGVPTDPFAGRLPVPPPDARSVEFAAGPYGSLRRFVAGQAGVAGLVGTRVDDAVLAVSELVANTYRHGSGAGTLRVWVDSRALVCEVDDASHPVWDLLVGRRCPPSDQLGGRGLWVVNQICDLVQISTADGRTTVRLHISRD
jgi:anti-sigma regulatory factor (Ser/Thr protein kinase)